MALLKEKFRAETLAEVLVASVIMLILFGITLDTLTRLSLRGGDLTEEVAAENDMRRVKSREIQGKMREGGKSEIFGWGRMEIEWREYNAAVSVLTLKAVLKKNGGHITYRFLVLKNED